MRRRGVEEQPTFTSNLRENPWLKSAGTATQAAEQESAPEPAPTPEVTDDSPAPSTLPLSFRGYEREATDSLVQALQASLEEAWAAEEGLRRRVEELEAELRRHREHERELRVWRIEAKRAAVAFRGQARREAEAALKKARARADELIEGAARERERLEQELSRQRALAEVAQTGLFEFLFERLQRLKALGSAGAASATAARAEDNSPRTEKGWADR
jgi:cell division septum initiation protein DivIVA